MRFHILLCFLPNLSRACLRLADTPDFDNFDFVSPFKPRNSFNIKFVQFHQGDIEFETKFALW